MHDCTFLQFFFVKSNFTSFFALFCGFKNTMTQEYYSYSTYMCKFWPLFCLMYQVKNWGYTKKIEHLRRTSLQCNWSRKKVVFLSHPIFQCWISLWARVLLLMLYYYQIRNISIENLKYFSRAVFLKNKTVHRYYSKLKYLKDQIPEEIHYLVTTYRRNEVVEETST